ncbi:MAG: tyrosyl-tRNA synthetase [Candidatus Peregrinibacteria bacterium Greene0416_19]|nr:MAG: tyrosyl-tRNA synthetase [Candidatus Peregrinibacteria bacterium Greene0416_19]
MNADELLLRAVSDVVPRELAEKKLASGSPMRIYLGIDPTGAKLHLGHSVPLRKLKAFQDAGHHVIFLIGSFTAMIGDPSGREKEREPLTKEQVMKNFETYREQAGKILDFTKVEVRPNHEWLEKLGFREILSLARQFTVQQMIERDMFERRLVQGNPIGVHEFLYPLMVGYDSVALDVDCELGGSDQYFNMLAGRTLQKAFGKRDKFVLTTKLIEGTDGRKMSKTYDNCIWIEDTAQEMYGKILSIKDELIVPYMECVTGMPMKDVKEAAEAMAKGDNPKDWKMKLAREVVTLYHDRDAAKAAEEEFDNVFAKKGVPDDVEMATVEKGSLLVDVMVKHGLVPSKGEARRLIGQKGVHLNEKIVEAVDAKVEEGLLKVGKRRFLKIAIV